MNVRCLRLFPAVLAVLALTGCAGYRLGPSNGITPGERSVRITPFSNQTLEPRFGDAVTTALRRRIQSDGTYHLATSGDADVVVTGIITQYIRHELSFVPNDVLTVRDFRVNAAAQVTARDTITGKVLFDRRVTGYTLVRVGSDLTSAERQALPLLADDLAKQVTSLLMDGTW